MEKERENFDACKYTTKDSERKFDEPWVLGFLVVRACVNPPEARKSISSLSCLRASTPGWSVPRYTVESNADCVSR